jgi:antitoxin (DNA-binding transcriptional repressor) of toxin-antitoxin stability system
MLFHMKTASVRDLRQHFPRVLAWIQSGEEVAITLRREEIARLVPRRKKKLPTQPFPNLTERLKRVFGSTTIPDQAMHTIMEQNRGEF